MTADITPHPKQRRHSWPKEGEVGFSHVHRDRDGRERFERTCKFCGIKRITLLTPDDAWHEWQRGDAKPFQMESTPPCQGEARSLREHSEVSAI